MSSKIINHTQSLLAPTTLNRAIRTSIALSLGLTSIMASTATIAQTQNLPTTTLDTINIFADSYRTTGTKTALEPEDSPISYTRIDNQILENRFADSVNDALQYEAGVGTDIEGSSNIVERYNIRGYETVSNYYDGLRLPFNGAWNLKPQIDSFATESVEVVKGSAGSLYGYGSPGGMVNQVSKSPKSQSSHSVRLRGGSHNLAEVGLDSTGALTDNLNYRLVALGRNQNGTWDTTKNERIMVNPSLEWKATEDLTVDVNVYYQNDPKMVPSAALPAVGTVYEASYGKLDASDYAGDEWNNYEREALISTLGLNWNVTDNLTFKHLLRYTDTEGLQKNSYLPYRTPPKDDFTLERAAYSTDETMKSIQTDNQLAYQFNTGNIHHNVLFGIDYTDSDSTAIAQYAINTPTLDLRNINNDLYGDSLIFTKGSDVVMQQKQLGYYLQNEIEAGDLTVIAGVRHDNYKSSSTDSVTKASSEGDHDNVSGRLALMYDFDNGISPYVSYSEAFQPVGTVNSKTGKLFSPETSSQVEAGFKYSSDDNDTKMNLAVFDINKKNIVDGPDYFNLSQGGENVSRGLEVGVSHRVNNWMDVSGAFSYTDAKIVENKSNPAVEGKNVRQIARNKATLMTSLYPTDDFQFNIGVRHQSDMPIDDLNSDILPSVTLLDVGGEYFINNWLKAGFNVNNATNKRYVASCYSTSYCWMGPEREFAVSLTAEF